MSPTLKSDALLQGHQGDLAISSYNRSVWETNRLAPGPIPLSLEVEVVVAVVQGVKAVVKATVLLVVVIFIFIFITTIISIESTSETF